MLANTVSLDNVVDHFRDRMMTATEGRFNGKALLLFSGGRDSSAVAGVFSLAFPKDQLHLLTLDNGVLSSTDPAMKQAALIKGLFPSVKISTEIRSSALLMARAGIQQIEKDLTQRGYKTLLICVACKLAMTAVAAKYAREHDIQLILDGYAERQQDYPEQTEYYIQFVQNYYRKAGLLPLSPLYDVLTSKELVNDLLTQLGIVTLKQEGKCMFGDSFSTASEDDIVRFVAERMQLIEEIMEAENG